MPASWASPIVSATAGEVAGCDEEALVSGTRVRKGTGMETAIDDAGSDVEVVRAAVLLSG